MKLYEISKSLRDAMDQLADEETGEVLPEALEALDRLESDFGSKAEAVGCYVKELRAEAAAIKAEEDQLKTRRAAAERKADSMITYLSNCMQATGHDKVKTARVALSFRAGEKVNVIDPGLLSHNFLRVKPPEPDKTAIKAAIKAGQTVPGAEIVRTLNLQIK